MALLVLYFFLVSGQLSSYNAQTTYRNNSPTAESTVTNPNATAQTTYRNTSPTAETTFTNATATAETTFINTTATGCSDPPVLCCPGRNNSCRRTCYCDEACVELGDCCSDFNLTCIQFFNSTNSSTPSPPLTETTESRNTSATSDGVSTSTSTSAVFNSTNSSTPSPPLTETTESRNTSATSDGVSTSTSTSADFQTVTLHLRVSLLTREGDNKDGNSVALFNLNCESCSLILKDIKFN
ncbi:uncharacterized protein FYW61_011248 isoform 2-T2 [Anableps anableps]